MSPQIKNIHYKLLFLLVTAFEIVYLYIYQWSNDDFEFKALMSHSLLFVFICAIYLLLLIRNTNILFSGCNKVLYLYIGLSISCIFTFVTNPAPVKHLWLLGCIFLSAMYSTYMGILNLLLLFPLNCINMEYNIRTSLFMGILGGVLCLVFSFYPEIKKASKLISTYICFVIITLCCEITLVLIINGLDYTYLFEKELLVGSLYTVGMVTIAFVARCLRKDNGIVTSENVSDIDVSANSEASDTIPDNVNDVNVSEANVTEADETQVEEAYIGENVVNYGKFLSPSYELLLKIRNEKPSIFKHCRIVSQISRQAAGAIGADEMLAAVGGMYHEVGKLISNDNFIEHNNEIAEQYGFDARLTGVITEHNAKIAVPHSKEAAIIYITDNLIASIYYVMHVKKATNLTKEMIVKNFFDKRLEDNVLNESGLTVKDFTVLKQFYINYFKGGQA